MIRRGEERGKNRQERHEAEAGQGNGMWAWWAQKHSGTRNRNLKPDDQVLRILEPQAGLNELSPGGRAGFRMAGKNAFTCILS